MFLGSCSLVATGKNNNKPKNTTFITNLIQFTAGHSSESKNVAIWDTLLPQKKSMVSCEYISILNNS